MTYPGSDGKSDVDKPFRPEQQGQAKQSFDKVVEPKPEQDRRATDRTETGRFPESIKAATTIPGRAERIQATQRQASGDEQKVSDKSQAKADDRVPDSINKHAPGMSFDMPGGGAIKAAEAGKRLSKEAAAEKTKQSAVIAASKKVENPKEMEQNKSNNQDKGRE